MGGLAVSGDLCAAEGRGQSEDVGKKKDVLQAFQRTFGHDDAMAGPAHHAGWPDSNSDSSRGGLAQATSPQLMPPDQALAELGLAEDLSSGQTEDQGDFRPPPGLEPAAEVHCRRPRRRGGRKDRASRVAFVQRTWRTAHISSEAPSDGQATTWSWLWSWAGSECVWSWAFPFAMLWLKGADCHSLSAVEDR